MKTLLAWTAVAFLLQASGFAAEKGPFLTGTFRSDKEATVERWRKEKRFGEKTPKVIEILGKILGKQVVTITASRLRSESEGKVEEQAYEVVRRDGTNGVIRVYSAVLKRSIESRIEVTSDGYWLYSEDPVKNYCEKYRRVK